VAKNVQTYCYLVERRLLLLFVLLAGSATYCYLGSQFKTIFSETRRGKLLNRGSTYIFS